MGRDSSSLHETRPGRHIRRSSSGLGAAAAACFTPSVGATKGGQAGRWLSPHSLVGVTGVPHCLTLTSMPGCMSDCSLPIWLTDFEVRSSCQQSQLCHSTGAIWCCLSAILTVLRSCCMP